MEQETAQVLGTAVGGCIAIGGMLLTQWISAQREDRRHRRELYFREKESKHDRQATFAQSLLGSRVKAHEEVLACLYDLRVYAHYYVQDSTNRDYVSEFHRARNKFRVAVGFYSIWILTAAVETLQNVDKSVEGLTESTAEATFALIGQAVQRLHWSLGLESLESYLKYLWGAPPPEPMEE